MFLIDLLENVEPNIKMIFYVFRSCFYPRKFDSNSMKQI